MDVHKSRRLPSAATISGVKYRLLLRVYAAENLRNVSSHGTYCKVYVGNVDMAASRKGRQSFKKFLMSSSLSSSSTSSNSSSATTPGSSYSSSTSSAGSPDPQENTTRSRHNIQNSNNNTTGINTSGTRIREFKTQVQKYSRASPVWNEKFEIPSVDPAGDLVSIRVKSARLMSSPAVGACCVPLRDVPEDETVDRWVTLLDGKRDAGRIRIQMRLIRADAPPAVKKESNISNNNNSSSVICSRSQASDPAAADQVRASARRTSSKRSDRSSDNSSLLRTRLSGSISPVAKQVLQSTTTGPTTTTFGPQPPRKFSNSSNHSSSSSASSSSRISRSQSRKSNRTQSEREASAIAATYLAGPKSHSDNSRSDGGVSKTTTDSMADRMEHASETSSSLSSYVSEGRIPSDMATATHSTTSKTTAASRHTTQHSQGTHDDEDEDSSSDVVDASSLYTNSHMHRLRDRGTMLSEVGASSSSSSSRSNGSFVGSLHLYNRNSIATSTPSRTTVVMSEAEIVSLHSDNSTSSGTGVAGGSGSAPSGRRNPNGDDRNSGQTEDTDSDDEFDDEPETEGPRIPWNSTITRLLARKSTNILIDEDEDEDSDDDDDNHHHVQQRHGNHNDDAGFMNSVIGIHDRLADQRCDEEVPLLDFPEPYDIDDIDCA